MLYSISVKQQQMLSDLFIKLRSGNLPYITYKEENSLFSCTHTLLNE